MSSYYLQKLLVVTNQRSSLLSNRKSELPASPTDPGLSTSSPSPQQTPTSCHTPTETPAVASDSKLRVKVSQFSPNLGDSRHGDAPVEQELEVFMRRRNVSPVGFQNKFESKVQGGLVQGEAFGFSNSLSNHPRPSLNTLPSSRLQPSSKKREKLGDYSFVESRPSSKLPDLNSSLQDASEGIFDKFATWLNRRISTPKHF